MLFNGKSIKSIANKVLNKLLHSRDETVVEVKADAWKSMYPFFCNQALSAPDVATELLKILDVLIDYGIVGDYKNLQKVLLHKNNEVAHLALDVLRKIKGLTAETRIEGVKPVSAESSTESIEKVPQEINQQIKEIELPVQNEKDLQSRIFNVLKREDPVPEKTSDIEEKVDELCQKISEAPSNPTQDYDNKFKALEDGMEELKKSVNPNIVNENVLVEKAVAEKLADIEEKVEELCQKTPEIPSNPTQDYDNKFKALEDSMEELKKSVNLNIVNENALVEKAVAEKLTDIEEKVDGLCQKISEAPSNPTQDYDNKFKALEDGMEELKKSVNPNIVNENALVEKVVSKKLADIEEKVDGLCQKISEAPSNLTQDYDNKFKALQGNVEELKKLVNPNIVNETAPVEKAAGQVLGRIKPNEHIPKSEISSIPQLMQKKAEDSQYSEEQKVRLHFLDNTPETSIILLNWVKFLMEKVGRNNLSDILEYYVEIGWISEEISSMMADYANGIDYYVEKSTWNLPEVHTKSLLFIEQLRRRKKDKKLFSLLKYKQGSTIPAHGL